MLVVGTVSLATTGFTAAGDYEPAIFAAVAGWPVVLGLFWLLGTAALLAAQQPRAAGVVLACRCDGVRIGYSGTSSFSTTRWATWRKASACAASA